MPNVLTVITLLPGMAPNPVDEGSLRPGLDPSQVTPGMIGFLMSLLLAGAVILLALDFNRRNRRLRYRAEYAERRAAEERVGGYADRPGPAGESGAVDEPGPAGELGAVDDPGAAAAPRAGRPGTARPTAAGGADASAADEEPAPPPDRRSARRS